MMLRSAMMFLQGAGLQEASLRGRSAADAGAEHVAVLFAQTGALCDFAAARAEELVRTDGSATVANTVRLTRLLGLRLSIVCAARAMMLRRKVRAAARHLARAACLLTRALVRRAGGAHGCCRCAVARGGLARQQGAGAGAAARGAGGAGRGQGARRAPRPPARPPCALTCALHGAGERDVGAVRHRRRGDAGCAEGQPQRRRCARGGAGRRVRVGRLRRAAARAEGRRCSHEGHRAPGVAVMAPRVMTTVNHLRMRRGLLCGAPRSSSGAPQRHMLPQAQRQLQLFSSAAQTRCGTTGSSARRACLSAASPPARPPAPTPPRRRAVHPSAKGSARRRKLPALPRLVIG
jgi:hypothetical protein